MSVQSVNSSHFIVAGNKKKTLNLKVRGNVLMFFKMDNCPGCAQFEPLFYQLSSQMQNVTFLVANISHDRNIIGMSRQTNTPIEKVPYIMLYVNGLPKAKFNGKKNIPSLQNFVSKVLDVVTQQQQSSFVQPQPQGYRPGGSQGYHPGGYAQQPPEPKVYQPDIQMPKGMNSAIRGKNVGGYQYMNEVEDDDEIKLELPGQVTPYNTPWDTKYKKMGDLD